MNINRCVFLFLQRFVFLFFFLGSSVSLLNGQAWTNRYSEDGQMKSFEQLSSEFDKYWSGRKITKGSGYKPFMRWKYQWENHFNKNSELPNAGHIYKEFETYSKSSDQNRSSMSQWESIGPNGNAGDSKRVGRINCVAFDPTNEDIIYAGSAGGGLWKSLDGGDTWVPKTDFIGSIGISAIVVDPIDTDIIYIATGDGDGFNNYSIGVLKSTNGGDTWSATGLDWSGLSGKLIHGLVMNPGDNNMLLIVSNDGIWRTEDAGDTWILLAPGVFVAIEMKPSETANTVYVAKGARVYTSTDNGENWTCVLFVAGSNRLTLATTPDDEDYVYALSSSAANNGYNGLYRSVDSGQSFVNMSTTPNILGYSIYGGSSGGQGFYDLALTVAPTNKDQVHVGGINHWTSTDGGGSWEITNYYDGNGMVPTVHADKHVLRYQNDVKLWEGNDGGLYLTSDEGETFIDRTGNMVISQMYRIGVSELDNKIVAGLQDNGTKLLENDTPWTDELPGDGMNCAINHENSDIMYGCSQNGTIRITTNGGIGFWDFVRPTTGGAWVTPFELNPQNPSTIIAGYKDVWKSTNHGDDWTIIGSNLAGSDLTHLAIAPSDSNYIYVGRNNSLFRTTDGGSNWTTMTVPTDGDIPMITISKLDANVIYTVRDAFSAGEKVFKSTDGGATWNNISGTLPNIRARSITVHDDGNETVYIGMEVGVYYRSEGMSDWVLYNTDLPNADVREVEIKESTNEIYIATYGRGAWKNSTIGETARCANPIDVDPIFVGVDSIATSWDSPDTMPEDGYEYVFSMSPDTPLETGIITTNTSANLGGLNPGDVYYFHVRSVCTNIDKSDWISVGPMTVKNPCGIHYYDKGGISLNYYNNQDYTVTVYPTEAQEKVKFIFESFSVENNWDALYIYDGESTSDPLFDSGNPNTNGGDPAGGYWGNTVPEPLTSTHATGSLTYRLISDGSLTRFGWDINAVCEQSCTTIVSNLDNDGYGSLRDAVACVENGDNITLHTSVLDQSIVLETSIEISKITGVVVPISHTINVSVLNTGPVFQVANSGEFTLENMTILGGTMNTGAAIINDGVLNLHDVTINPKAESTPASLIENNGTLEISGLTKLGSN